MHEPTSASPDFLSTLPAGPRERRLARAVVGVSLLFFLLAVPFAKVPLPKVWAFIPIYQASLVINDLITVVLLLGQYAMLRTRSLLVLACAYLFTGAIAVLHGLTFPGLFAPDGLLGAGKQSTAWLYMFWHGGFPFFIIAYVLLKDREREGRQLDEAVYRSIAFGALATLGLVAACGMLATLGKAFFPDLLVAGRYTPAMHAVITAVWLLSLVALAALWFRRPHALLDEWLIVVMYAWLFDIGLSAVFNAGRFDLGFYAGRAYGLLAASFVLMVLLLENGMLYARLLGMHAREQKNLAELRAANQELESFSYSVSHDLRSPLRAVDGYACMLERRVADRFDAEERRLLGVIRGNAKQMGTLIDDLLAFSRLGRQQLSTQSVALNTLVAPLVAQLQSECHGRNVEFVVGELGCALADPGLLRQVLANLLGNAVKFTRQVESARIEVGCRTLAGGTAVYHVSDNGAGFDMRFADKLFRVFERLHDGADYEGSGIGLSIVQRIVQRHGGRIWAESEPGGGATFYFTLAP
ncbi:sensor histidine kinase [Chitinimonas arctica]|uniref:sensor histidine kinase n=1 Tax=Chitinimonas arctica TaxID=2594795 RepID=UPI001CC7B62E|nr:MASE4 domain-containing protein [Chitinimonas arctica]